MKDSPAEVEEMDESEFSREQSKSESPAPMVEYPVKLDEAQT